MLVSPQSRFNASFPWSLFIADCGVLPDAHGCVWALLEAASEHRLRCCCSLFLPPHFSPLELCTLPASHAIAAVLQVRMQRHLLMIPHKLSDGEALGAKSGVVAIAARRTPQAVSAYRGGRHSRKSTRKNLEHLRIPISSQFFCCSIFSINLPITSTCKPSFSHAGIRCFALRFLRRASFFRVPVYWRSDLPFGPGPGHRARNYSDPRLRIPDRPGITINRARKSTSVIFFLRPLPAPSSRTPAPMGVPMDRVVRNFNEAIATFTSLKAVDSVAGVVGEEASASLHGLPAPPPLPLRQLQQVSCGLQMQQAQRRGRLGRGLHGFTAVHFRGFDDVRRFSSPIFVLFAVPFGPCSPSMS